EPLGTSMLSLANSVMPSVQAGMTSLIGILTNVVSTVQTMASAIGGNAAAFASLSPPLQTVVSAAQGLIAAFQSVWQAAQPLVSVIQANLLPILGTLGAV